MRRVFRTRSGHSGGARAERQRNSESHFSAADTGSTLSSMKTHTAPVTRPHCLRSFAALAAAGAAVAFGGAASADSGVTVFSARSLNASLTFNGFHGWETVADMDSSNAVGTWNGSASVFGASASENSTTGVDGAVGTMSLSSYAPYPGASNSTWTNSTHSTKFVLAMPKVVSLHCDWVVQRDLSASAHFTFKLSSISQDFVLEDLTFSGVPAGVTEGALDDTVTLPAGAYFLTVFASSNSPGPGLSGLVELEANFNVSLTDPPTTYLDVPAQYATINAALNAAQNGNVIRVAGGTYHERLSFGSKRVSLIAANASDDVVIDGDGSAGSLVAMTDGQDPSVLISGITFRNAVQGTFVPSLGTTAGGAIFLQNASPRIEHCLFEANNAGAGGAIAALHSAPQIVDCDFRGNQANSNGGAVACINADTALTIVIDGGAFLCNEAASGGAIWASGILAGDISASALHVCNNSEPQLVLGVPFPGSVVCNCPGDLDGDASVDADDLAALLGAWGTGSTPADVDCDGEVGAGDLAVLLGAWGSCS